MTHTDDVATMAAADRRTELEAELPLIVERLVRLGASKIVLFGSLARGEVGPTSDIDILQVRSAVGFGLRYRSPVGPIRVDLGFKVHPQEIVPGRREGR